MELLSKNQTFLTWLSKQNVAWLQQLIEIT